MREMSISPKCASSTHNRAKSDNKSLAIQHMRYRHRWPFPDSKWANAILDSSCRSFLQMGRSRSCLHYNKSTSVKFFPKRNHLSFQNSKNHHNRQRTTPKASTGRTPYSLTYRCEAMVPVEIGMPTIRVQYFDEQQNEENTRLCLDFLEERREHALMHIESYKQRMATYHNKRVKPLKFEVGDLVLRRADIVRGNTGVSKLGANWEGRYQVNKVGKGGAYYP
ncbi:uncharacterized protein LOC126656961 [Mercurialis annua]|uniref:uncharacterized protein LOC126656961 n=1 Tax=Mercurialis annua TaxID=3986 RepID=UPI0021608288|nr:uncharacterized protein LOC126656961 [Mercurialis annua]